MLLKKDTLLYKTVVIQLHYLSYKISITPLKLVAYELSHMCVPTLLYHIPPALSSVFDIFFVYVIVFLHDNRFASDEKAMYTKNAYIAKID